MAIKTDFFYVTIHFTLDKALVWKANMEIGLDPNKSATKKLWTLLNYTISLERVLSHMF